MADILSDEATDKSPVENLPVASGKRRRGRPRKAHVAAQVMEAVPELSSSGSGDVASVVEAAVSKALKRNKPAGPHTRKGIVGLAKQVVRSQVRKQVQQELGNTDPAAGDAAVVREALSADDAQDALTTDHGQSSPYWHMIRFR